MTGMTLDEFVDNFESSYKGKFSDADVKEIKSFFIEMNFNEVSIQNLYTVIRRNYIKSHDIPTFGQIVDYWDKHCKHTTWVISSENLHPQSPLQQLYRAKDWPVEKILNNCDKIRLQIDKIGARNIPSWCISFLSIWEKIKAVKPEYLEEAKKRIVENADRELSQPVNLEDIMIIENVKIKISEDRTGHNKQVGDILGEVI